MAFGSAWTWRETGLDGRGAVAGGLGWVIVGEAGDPPGVRMVPAAWTSVDGRAWTRASVELPADLQDGTIELVAAGPSGLVAAGPVYPKDGADGSGAVWSSLDGHAWDLIGSGSTLDLGPCIEGCARFTSIATTAALVVVTGYRIASDFRAEATVWSMSGGGAWQRAALPVAGADRRVAGESSVTATRDGFLVAGSVCDANGTTCRGATWTSTYAVDWNGPYDLPGGDGCSALRVVAGASHTVILGQRCADVCSFTAWASPDGIAWTKSDLEEANVRSPEYGLLTFAGGQFLAIGSRAGSGEVWTSPDGMAWHRVVLAAPFPELLRETLLADVAGRPDGVLVVGFGPNETSGVWTSH